VRMVFRTRPVRTEDTAGVGGGGWGGPVPPLPSTDVRCLFWSWFPVLSSVFVCGPRSPNSPFVAAPRSSMLIAGSRCVFHQRRSRDIGCPTSKRAASRHGGACMARSCLFFVLNQAPTQTPGCCAGCKTGNRAAPARAGRSRRLRLRAIQPRSSMEIIHNPPPSIGCRWGNKKRLPLDRVWGDGRARPQCHADGDGFPTWVFTRLGPAFGAHYCARERHSPSADGLLGYHRFMPLGTASPHGKIKGTAGDAFCSRTPARMETVGTFSSGIAP